MAPPPMIVGEALAAIQNAYRSGATIAEIARKQKLSTSTVWKYLKRSGIERRPAGPRITARKPRKPGKTV